MEEGSMEWLQAWDTALADLGLEPVRAWTLWLTAVERWLMPHLARRAARHHAWADRRGLLRPVARTNGWQQCMVRRRPTVSSICWGGHTGMRPPSARMCAPSWCSP